MNLNGINIKNSNEVSGVDGIAKLMEASGIEVEDKYEIAMTNKEKLEEKSSFYRLNEVDMKVLRHRAVKEGLIPAIYENASFDREKVQTNITALANSKNKKFNIRRGNDYFDAVEGIISTIRSKQLPNRSYLIGAPNSFGKMSFAVDCIIASLHNGWLTVPYISLMELAEIKTANDRVLMRGLMGIKEETQRVPFNYTVGSYDGNGEYTEDYYSYDDTRDEIKRPRIITGQYSWSEYINAPILMCFFSGIENKAVESNMLYTLLNIRSVKGFPTIATISTALTMYENDPVIGRFIWGEIKDEKNMLPSLSRVTHISCYKSSPFDKRDNEGI